MKKGGKPCSISLPLTIRFKMGRQEKYPFDQVLKRIQMSKNVTGVMVMNQDGMPVIIIIIIIIITDIQYIKIVYRISQSGKKFSTV